MLKRISAIGILSASLAACGGGGSNAASRSPVDPTVAYGNLSGQAVPYTGPLMAVYSSMLNLQGFIDTNKDLSTSLGGLNQFGICNGLNQTESLGLGLCEVNKFAINNNPNFAPLFNGSVNVNNFVALGAASHGITKIQPYRIMYNTNGGPYQFAGQGNAQQMVSAAILVPQNASGPLPVSQIKGVLLYYHPTVVSKGGVPSDFDGTLAPNLTANNSATVAQTNAATAFIQDATLAAIYAAQGFVVVVPDYIGQGANYQVQHPYVIFGPANAQTGLNSLKAARTALAGLGLNLPTPTKLYISSYSEGGSYALWASQLAQTSYAGFLTANGFTLRRTVGVSGAYDLTGATLHYEFDNASNSLDPKVNTWNVSPGLIPGPQYPFPPTLLGLARAFAAINLAASKTSLAGYVLTALAYYNSSATALNVLAPQYAPMQTCLDWAVSTGKGVYPTVGTIPAQNAGVKCPLPYDMAGLYNTAGLTQTDIVDQAFAAAAFVPSGPLEFLTGGKTFNDLAESLGLGVYTNNSVGSFVEPGVLTDPTIIPYVSQSNIQSWVTNSPIDIMFLNYDSTVPNINALEACGDLPASAKFPGYQPGYTGGVKQLSPAGMVTCVNLANNGVGSIPQLFTEQGGIPLMLDHGQAETVLQIMALNQILANP